MNTPVRQRLAPAMLALGIAAGSIGLVAGTASASSSSSKGKHEHSGSTCTKSELNQTIKVGSTTLTCKQITLYEWQK